MSLETAQHIFQLNASYPSATDRVRDGDDHIRQLKAVLKTDLGSLAGPLTVTAEFLNGLAAALDPVGTIKAWYGIASTVPVGFTLCNGVEVDRTDGTGKITPPDLQGRVIVGASAALDPGTVFGQQSKTVTSAAAGSHSHTATIDAAGDHAHTLSGSTGSSPAGVSMDYRTYSTYAGGGTQVAVAAGHNGAPPTITDPGHTHAMTGSTANAGSHTHTGTIAAAGDHAHAITIDVSQPSFALHYIMRI